MFIDEIELFLKMMYRRFDVFLKTKESIVMKKGRLMVQGLVNARIGTKIGDDLHFIAREIVSDFILLVFIGD
jgi:hypothetical protein